MLELLVALVIAALLVSLAVPTYGMFVQQAKVFAAVGHTAELGSTCALF